MRQTDRQADTLLTALQTLSLVPLIMNHYLPTYLS